MLLLAVTACPAPPGLGFGMSEAVLDTNRLRPPTTVFAERNIGVAYVLDGPNDAETTWTTHESVWSPSIADKSQIAFEIPTDAILRPSLAKAFGPGPEFAERSLEIEVQEDAGPPRKVTLQFEGVRDDDLVEYMYEYRVPRLVPVLQGSTTSMSGPTRKFSVVVQGFRKFATVPDPASGDALPWQTLPSGVLLELENVPQGPPVIWKVQVEQVKKNVQ